MRCIYQGVFQMENETIEQIPVEDLHVFRNHTFQVKDDEEMKALMESTSSRW